METITIPKDELVNIIKKTVKESIALEFMKLKALLIPYISDEEQKDIEKLYNEPSNEIAHSTMLEI